jgi:alginate O-acetyltransferase complex protein AlgI
MLFNTIEFWLFFIPVLLLVHSLRHRAQNIVLLVASYIFYGAWDWRFLSLIFISTVVDYYAGPFATPSRSKLSRKLALTASIVVNLGILGFFKYHNFFVQSFADLFHLSNELTNAALLNLILPVGISFYTFQTMSYTFDIHAGRIKPVSSFFDFALYVSFFPQLVAGPIERGSRLIPQIINPRKVDAEKLTSALYLIAWGLFKKVFIADTIAHSVNAVFAGSVVTGPQVYVAVLGFAVQIYCDFSGYSDIARGLARLLGFELMVNFNLPYFAKNPAEFWRRWHISLSTWLRDYLYIPLGGNRKGRGRTYFNLMITMLLGGLWHGARYNFILWGLFHGVILSAHRLLTGNKQSSVDSKFVTVVKIVFMFHLTLFGWLLFRAESLSQISNMSRVLLTGWTHLESSIVMLKYMAPGLICLAVYEFFQLKTKNLEVINRAPWLVRVLFLSLCISVVLLLNRSSSVPFIYFQF